MRYDGFTHRKAFGIISVSAPDASPHLKTLPPNRAGRDFLLGDLHGMMDELTAAMQAAGFDRSRDRIISVGDLIDRGPDNLAAQIGRASCRERG